MEPILKSHFVKFKKDFEIETRDDPQKEASAFEKFVNYTVFSLENPDAFTADTELLDFMSVGGRTIPLSTVSEFRSMAVSSEVSTRSMNYATRVRS
jgi:hypothetical protein